MSVTNGGPTRRRQKRATSADVARLAGVSRTTVSFVLNETSNQTIPPETRARVLQAAEALRYMPSSAALTLRTGVRRIALCMLPALNPSEPVTRLLSFLTRDLGELGLVLLVHQGSPGDAPVNAADLWAAVDPAVVLTSAPLSESSRELALGSGIALLEVGPHGGALTGRAYQEAIGFAQASHLIGLGHRNLGFAGTAERLEERFGQPRYEGVARACREQGLPTPTRRVFGPLGGQAIGATLHDWTQADQPITAICAHNDEVALSLMAGARFRMLKIPDRVSIVGVDDTAAGRSADPPLTSVQLRLDVASARAAVAVAALLEVDPPPRLESVAARPGLLVIQRGSSAPPRGQ